MTSVHFAIPGDLAAPTGGYAYDRRVMALLPSCGVEVHHLPLPGGFPLPADAELAETARLLAGVPADAILLADGLAYGALPVELLSRIAAPVIVLLHHPLGLETGLSDAARRRLLASEKAALAMASHVIVTSDTTAAMLSDLGFAPPPPVTAARPGTDRVNRAAGAGGGCTILSVGSLVPRKGYDVLVEAFSRLDSGNWRSIIAGSPDLDPACAAALRKQIKSAGLERHITLTGALNRRELQALYARAGMFVLPSRYEGYGMAFAEALAHGLPVIAARAGAVPETVPPTAGILVAPDDAAALAGAMARLIEDRGLRQRLSDAAWAHALTLPRWEDTAATIAGVIREVERERLFR